MVEFEKSTKYQGHYYVSDGKNTEYIRNDQVASLKNALESAADQRTGYGNFSFSGGKVIVHDDNQTVEVLADERFTGNGHDKCPNRGSKGAMCNMSGARDLVQRIENEAIRQATIRTGFQGM